MGDITVLVALAYKPSSTPVKVNIALVRLLRQYLGTSSSGVAVRRDGPNGPCTLRSGVGDRVPNLCGPTARPGVGLPESWTEGDVETNGARLHYYRSGGDGRPLVVAHGITSNGRSRIPLVEALADDDDVMTYDFRGHGRSSAPESGWDEEALAVVMEDPGLMLRLGDEGDDEDDVDPGWEMMLERIHGTPAGSPETLLERDPELVELVEAGREQIATLLAHAYLNVDSKVGQVLESEGPAPADLFPDTVAPTLVLRADVDADARELDREAVSLLPDGRLVHVAGAGHCVLRDEHERAFGELRQFLEDHP
jgi:pimeloyl-ACP methyl ester carboxylesterase